MPAYSDLLNFIFGRRSPVATVLTILSGSICHADAAAPLLPPNIVLIVADDLALSDIGAYGGEIDTPNLDALAQQGLRLSNFHAAPTCSPSRSMLLSGSDNHTAGLGAMAEVTSPTVKQHYGYEGHLSRRITTLPERLAEKNYQTFFAGKWHLGMTPDSQPEARGFDHSYALLQGGHNHFGKGGFGPDSFPTLAANYREDGQPVEPAADFYSSDSFTDKLIAQLRQADTQRPFFVYLAYTAPHSPLQAPKSLIKKYTGRYDQGWQTLAEQRFQKMQNLGLLPAALTLDIQFQQNWASLSPQQQKIESKKMEIYAAMVSRMDSNIGKLRNFLADTGRDKNTLFIFISDNGPAGETGETFSIIPGMKKYLARFDNSLENMGSASSFVFLGHDWATAAAGPLRGYKSLIYEGGTRVPAIISMPGMPLAGQISSRYSHIMDILPTVLDLAGATPNPQQNAIHGTSLTPLLQDANADLHRSNDIAYELHQQRSIQRGDWKATFVPIPTGNGHWELFNVQQDPSESNDISSKHPKKLIKLIDAWMEYARDAKVLGIDNS